MKAFFYVACLFGSVLTMAGGQYSIGAGISSGSNSSPYYGNRILGSNAYSSVYSACGSVQLGGGSRCGFPSTRPIYPSQPSQCGVYRSCGNRQIVSRQRLPQPIYKRSPAVVDPRYSRGGQYIKRAPSSCGSGYASCAAQFYGRPVYARQVASSQRRISGGCVGSCMSQSAQVIQQLGFGLAAQRSFVVPLLIPRGYPSVNPQFRSGDRTVLQQRPTGAHESVYTY